jgi:hypothetical protein
MDQFLNILIYFTKLLLELLTLILKIIQSNIPVILNIKDILMTIFAGIVSFTALYGLTAWRRQIKKNTEFNLARRILIATYKVRASFQNVRNISIGGGERQIALEKFNVDLKPEDKEYFHKSTRAVYGNRINMLESSFNDLSVELFEAEVIWGKGIHDIFKPLKECFIELLISIQDFLDDKDPNNYEKLDSEERQKIEKIIYLMNLDPNKDVFTKKIQDSIGKIENMIKPHLKL